MNDPLHAALAGVVGPDHVLSAPELRAGYEVDWTRRFRGTARLIVRPGTADEAATVMGLCATAGAPIVPQGGNTGLVGGAVPSPGSVVVSTRRLTAVGPIDSLSGQITVGAGATLAAVQDLVRPAGFDVAVDLAARESATVGGMIATNAGGIHAVRFGSMRSWVVGIEAYLAGGGRIGSLAGLRKNNTGYDWGSLFAASEGTLGLITSARLALVARPGHAAVALLGLETTDSAVAVAAAMRWHLPDITALELMFDEGIELVARHRRLAHPFTACAASAYLLVEVTGAEDPTDELTSTLASTPAIVEAVVALDEGDRRRLWELREAHTDAVAAEGIPYKLDVAVPIDRLAAFEHEARTLIASLSPTARTVIWGHIGDGSLHINVLGLETQDSEPLVDALLHLVIRHSGSISGEHGIGRAKARWLPLMHAPEDVAAMRAVKHALDPSGLMNPGVLFA